MSELETSAIDNLQALLFVAEEPVALSHLAFSLRLTEGQVEQLVDVLRARMAAEGPIQLVTLAGGYQLSTKPEYLPTISEFLQPQRQRISRSLMEVLAIVAYRQPVTVAEVDGIRGVQSDHAIRSLVERRLVADIGRKQSPGRPIIYGTTQQFLHLFNMNDLGQLPPMGDEFPMDEF